VTACAVEILTRAARQEPLAQDTVRSFVLALIASGTAGELVVRALEPGAHQSDAVIELAAGVLGAVATTRTNTG
jgi:hypothetical protein